MNRFRTTLRLILTAMLLMLAIGTNLASAQRPGTGTSASTSNQSYESELTGLEIAWSDDWELVSSDVTGNDEIVELQSEYGSLYTGFAMEDDAATARDVVVQGFLESLDSVETLDEGDSRGLAWALFEGEISSGDVAIVYVEVEEDVEGDYDLVSVAVALTDDFLDQYELVNQTVEVDGISLFIEFGVDEMGELLDTGATATTDTGATPSDNVDDQSETGQAGTDDTAARDSYTFEMDDIELTVTDDVEINDTQFEEDSYEQVLLVGMGSIGAVSLIPSPFDAERTLDGFMGGFLSEMEDSAEIDRGVEGGTAWAMYQATIGGADMYVYATVNDDMYESHYLELIAAPVDFFEDEFVVFQDSVQINGDGMFNGIDIDDLLAIIDAA